MKRLLDIIGALAAVAAIIITAFVGEARDDWDTVARQRRLDYIYMEALRQEALDNNEASFDLLRRAYDIDSTDTQLAANLAYYYVIIGESHPSFIDKGYSMLKRNFDADPADMVSSRLFGQLAQHLGHQDEALRVWQVLDSLYPQRDDLRLHYVDALLESGDSINISKALTRLDMLEKSIGANVQVTSRKGYAMIARGDTLGACDAIHSLLRRAPRNADNYVFASQFFMTLQRPDSAIRYLDMACQVDSTSGLAYYTRADYFRQRGDSAAFNRATTHALLYTDLDIDVKREMLINYIREFYNDSTQTASIDTLMTEVIARNPHEYDFHDIYASFLGQARRYAEAAEQADRALDINPSDPQQWRASIVYHALADDEDGAIATGAKALKYHPDDAKIYQLYGSTLTAANRYDEAIGVLQQALELTDSSDTENRSIFLATIGDIYHAKEMPDSAFAYYDRALEINPSNTLALNNMAYHLACADRDLERAERMSLATVRDEPDNPTYLDTYAWVLFKLRDYTKAREYIDRALEHEPEPTAELYEHAGDIYFFCGEPQQAIEFWSQAHLLDPDNALLNKKLTNKAYFYE